MAARFVFLIALAVGVLAQKSRFDNYSVYSVMPSSEGQVTLLREMQENADGLSFWRGAAIADASYKSNTPALIMVAPHKESDFKDMLLTLGLKGEIFMKDVQSAIDSENPVCIPKDFGWKAYYRLSEINTWLDSLVEKYPGVVTAIRGGRSFEGRDIKGVKISYKQGNPIVFIEAGSRAREWIAPATATLIVNKLLTGKRKEIRNAAENYDWVIFPVSNPDGYEYTHTSNRLWVKNRSRQSGLCVGVDLNRNWGYNWMKGGGSSNPCSEQYAGPSEFSETEIQGMSNLFDSMHWKVGMFISLHSFNQRVLIPYGHTTSPIPNYNDMMWYGIYATAGIIKQYGTEYDVGNIAVMDYLASGSSMDWVYGTFKTPFAYTIELRDNDTYGYLLPASQINPTGQETLAMIIDLIKGIKLNVTQNVQK